MYDLTVGEVVALLKKCKTKKERIEVLKKHDSVALQCILRMAFDPNIKFAVSDDVEYKKMDIPIGLGETNLKQQYKRFYLFLENKNRKSSPQKLKNLFSRLLEGLDTQEAELLIDVKNKKLKCGVTRKLLSEVYPQWFPPQKIKEKSNESKVEISS